MAAPPYKPASVGRVAPNDTTQANDRNTLPALLAPAQPGGYRLAHC
ncbi:MAG: hypothetical protein IT580_15740 [Verrucomicrobiales bacterium]|nr:hypothetical protein [Verrucomicrobiales bacterium]